MNNQNEQAAGAGAQDRGVARLRLVGLRAWTTIGCVILFVVAIRALGLVWPAVELLLVGVVVGFICSPITNWLEDLGVGRALAAFLALVLVLAVFVAVIVVLGPPFVGQLIEVLQRVPFYISQIRQVVSDFWDVHGSAQTADVQQTLDQLVSAASNLGLNASANLMEKLSTGLVDNLMSFVNNLFTTFLGLVVAYWFAKDYPRIAREFLVIVGPRHEMDFSVLLAVMSRSMGGYMRGIVTTSFVGGMLSFLGFLLIGHPFAGLMGITVGLFHFVPVIGPWIAAGLAAMLALFVSPMLAVESLVVSVIAQNVTDNLVSPLVMQSAVKVHPVLSLVGLIVGNSLGGVLGMALAIPLTAAIRSVFVYYFETKTGRQLVSYDGAFFKSTPFRDPAGNVAPAFDALDDRQFFKSTKLVDPQVAYTPQAQPRDGEAVPAASQDAKPEEKSR